MARESMCDAEVEREIQRLLDSPYVKLAKKEEQIRKRRLRYMYDLRYMEKKGKALAAAGVTMESLEKGCTDNESLAEDF